LISYNLFLPEGLKKVASALPENGRHEAMQLRIAENYIEQFGNLVKEGNTFILPSNLTDIASVFTMAKNVMPGGTLRSNS
jgi:hypothetical protein